MGKLQVSVDVKVRAKVQTITTVHKGTKKTAQNESMNELASVPQQRASLLECSLVLPWSIVIQFSLSRLANIPANKRGLFPMHCQILTKKTRIVTLFNKHSGVQAITYSDSYSHQTKAVFQLQFPQFSNTIIIRRDLRSMLCRGDFQWSNNIECVPALSLLKTE